MDWLTSFLLRPSARQISMLARDIAEQVVDDVRPHLPGQSATMSLAEARGYIRARAGCHVDRHVARAIAARKLPPQIHNDVVVRVKEHVVQSLIRDFLRIHVDAAVLQPAA